MNSLSPLGRTAILQNQIPKIREQLASDLITDSLEIKSLSQRISSIILQNVFKSPLWVGEKTERMWANEVSKWEEEVLFFSPELQDKLSDVIEKIFHQSILENPYEHISVEGSLQSVFSTFPLVIEYGGYLVDFPEVLLIISLNEKSLNILIEGVDLAANDFEAQITFTPSNLQESLLCFKGAVSKIRKLRSTGKASLI